MTDQQIFEDRVNMACDNILSECGKKAVMAEDRKKLRPLVEPSLIPYRDEYASLRDKNLVGVHRCLNEFVAAVKLVVQKGGCPDPRAKADIEKAIQTVENCTGHNQATPDLD